MNTSVLAAAEVLRGRHFTAIAASLPGGALVLLPTDTPSRLERCAEDQLVPGILLDREHQGDWETLIAEWVLECDGPLELALSSDVRLALRDSPAVATARNAAATWDCGPWPLLPALAG